MGKQQFLKNLISGVQSSFLQSQRNFFNQENQDKRIAANKEISQAKLNAKAAIQQQKIDAEAKKQMQLDAERPIIGQLLSGTLKRPEATKTYLNLSPEGRKLADAGKHFNSKPQFRNVGGNLYSVDAQGNLSTEPVIARESKIMSIVKGYNKNGEYVLKVYKDNGEDPIEMETGLRPTKSKDKNKSTAFNYDANKFDKVLNPHFNRLNEIESLKQQSAKANIFGGDILGTGTKFIDNKIKNIVNNERQTVYNLMLPKAQAKVNNFISQIEKKAKENNEDPNIYMFKKSNFLKQKFIEKITQQKIKGEISLEDLRVLSLWARFNFDYLDYFNGVKNAKSN